MKARTMRIFTDGSGQRPDGKGSGFAWCREGTNEKRITRANGLTNNQAEYRGILSALEYIPNGTSAQILTDSENTCCQLKGQRRVLDPKLATLYEQVRNVLKKKRLTVEFVWVPRKDNLAGKLL
ncbi:MAG: RNase H family protein [Candidatus Acidiferrales bacterium]